ncbi:hypothetical protein [Pseudanabaena sp. PCC 6802]|uniref:hypothetical protein n=1 Tax=Pseudanabaena sp. PCC 6802 TaxID=118173 RepID=UPI000349857F|nr:hypothetical protein [Pseudanabaena sp. PCC 6802]
MQNGFHGEWFAFEDNVARDAESLDRDRFSIDWARLFPGACDCLKKEKPKETIFHLKVKLEYGDNHIHPLRPVAYQGKATYSNGASRSSPRINNIPQERLL